MMNHSHHTPPHVHSHQEHREDNQHASHNKHEGHSPEMFKSKFWLSLIITIPIVLYAPMVQDWLGFSAPAFPGSRWLPFVLGTILFFYGGMVFLRSAWAELRAKQTGMMTLISLAILSAYVYSVATTLFLTGTEFFWELATLITIMLLGHWMEMKSVSSAQGALNELAKLLPDTAELVDGRTVPVAEVRTGDVVMIRPGASIPVDGAVTEGNSDVNESMVTGESKPVEKTRGSSVIAGTLNGGGSLHVRVTKTGDATVLAGIMRLVDEAQKSRSRAQILADRAAYFLTLAAIAAGSATFIAWLVAGQSADFALERTVTVLIIACPHALGLAIPLVTAISTSLGAKNGLLVRQRMALESARNIDTVLFDKTGTLTEGKQTVIDIWPAGNIPDKTILHLAASVERPSEHSLGKAVVDTANKNSVALGDVKNFKAISGFGVEAMLNGQPVSVGGPAWLRQKHASLPQNLAAKADQANRDGKTVLYVFQGDTVAGIITIADAIRPESKTAVEKLRAEGVEVAMITGDSEGVAAYVAKELGLDRYFAEVLPHRKADKVKELQDSGSRVAMVGDGVNDAPALAQADVGIAMGAGTDVAIESAGIILVRSNPLDIPKILKLSKATYRKMQQNLFWATGYNAVAIPLAGGILAGWGVILHPAVGAVLMSLSTVIVALNAQLLRRLKF